MKRSLNFWQHYSRQVSQRETKTAIKAENMLKSEFFFPLCHKFNSGAADSSLFYFWCAAIESVNRTPLKKQHEQQPVIIWQMMLYILALIFACWLLLGLWRVFTAEQHHPGQIQDCFS